MAHVVRVSADPPTISVSVPKSVEAPSATAAAAVAQRRPARTAASELGAVERALAIAAETDDAVVRAAVPLQRSARARTSHHDQQRTVRQLTYLPGAVVTTLFATIDPTGRAGPTRATVDSWLDTHLWDDETVVAVRPSDRACIGVGVVLRLRAADAWPCVYADLWLRDAPPFRAFRNNAVRVHEARPAFFGSGDAVVPLHAEIPWPVYGDPRLTTTVTVARVPDDDDAAEAVMRPDGTFPPDLGAAARTVRGLTELRFPPTDPTAPQRPPFGTQATCGCVEDAAADRIREAYRASAGPTVYDTIDAPNGPDAPDLRTRAISVPSARVEDSVMPEVFYR